MKTPRGHKRALRESYGVSAQNNQPSLKSASGAGFSFEDKVIASLISEMLAGQQSLGDQFGIIQAIEGQAGDWEPFGDLLVTVPNQAGEVRKIGVSIKSNRQITAAGCNKEFCAGIWSVSSKNVFTADRDALALFSTSLSTTVSNQVHALCRQARHLDPVRLDQKVVHKNARKIYDSFRNSAVAGAEGLPGNVLRHLIIREFDYETTVSRSEAEGLRLCREVLARDTRSEKEATRLWQELLSVAESARVTGGAITRASLSTLRYKFKLLDDPSDAAAWAKIQKFSEDCLNEIVTVLPGGTRLPRTLEKSALEEMFARSGGCCVLGDSGFGKSALVKNFAAERETAGDKIVWIKAERILQFDALVPDFEEVAGRSRRTSALLIVDAVEGCYGIDSLGRIARMIRAISDIRDSQWSVIVICQTPEWARVSATLIKDLGRHPVLTERIDCGPLSDEDFELVRTTSSSVNRLATKKPLRFLLRSPKMLDVLLTGQLAENRALAGEADLVEWWWQNQVRCGKPIAAEESVARQLAIQMAEELRSELPPDSVTGEEEAVSRLIQNRVLRLTSDGLIRFDHDLLADWSRVMHLKSLGDQSLPFMRAHIENPPWLRAVRLLSQHLLDRAAEIERWRQILKECSIPDGRSQEPSAQNLQIVDAWLEGVVFSTHPSQALEKMSDALFENRGWRLQRLLRRLMHVATIADPVLQDRVRQIDAQSAEAIAARYRLPILGIWIPVIDFLVSHKAEAIQMVPVEIGEIAGMWARMEDYLKLKWPALADLVMSNAETELRREVAGQYRHDRSPHGRGNKSRVTIYTGALQAASEHPQRATKLLLKAAGRAAWENDDVGERADPSWKGEWRQRGGLSYGEDYVEMPATAWPDGPKRKTSDDFFHAWFDGGASMATYRVLPQEACEATMAFLLDWPKRTLRPGYHGIGVDQHGFTFEADDMYPPFYTKGPFLGFLRQNWRPAIELIIRLTNFATERYADWWPYESKPTHIKFTTPTGEVDWLGNDQVYVWHRFNFNTPHVITCALMALEKWLDEQIAEGRSIKEPIGVIFSKGRSIAFAGLLVGLGKRHSELFLNELKPLLFVQQFFMYDFSAAREYLDGGYWPRDGKVINNLRREWSMLPGRKVPLLEACCGWFVGRPEFQRVLIEVGADWKKKAESLSGEDRLGLLRWAANFELSNWKKSVQQGQEIWQRDLPKELRDIEAERANAWRQANLTTPFRCSDLLEKRPRIDNSVLEAIWQQLNNWPSAEPARPDNDESDEFRSSLLDDKHSRAGLLAVLLSLGGDWLDQDGSRRSWVEDQVRQLISNPPKITAYSAEEVYDDGEGFLARCAVCCWAHQPSSEEWRGVACSFVSAFRYRSVAQLFHEAFRVRECLGGQYLDLEAFALVLAAVRQKAKLGDFNPKPEIISKWMAEWLPKFAKRRGPKWTDEWSKLEFIKPFPPPHTPQYGIPDGRLKRSRRSYGFDMGVLLAAFGGLPSLEAAKDAKERRHWLIISKELLAAYIRTLPLDDDDEEAEWRFDVSGQDREISNIVAGRIFECSPDEQRELWLPFLSLPPAAHHHITTFLSSLLIETIRTDPPQIAKLLPVWREMTKYLLSAGRWSRELRHKQEEVWKYVFLYGASVDSVRHKDHIPLVDGLRDLFEQHIRGMDIDPHDQSPLIGFLTTDAGQRLLPEALKWLGNGWEDANSYFWSEAAEDGHFETLFNILWKKYFSIIRDNPEMLKAFKTMTLNLAAQQVPIAVEIQQQIGS